MISDNGTHFTTISFRDLTFKCRFIHSTVSSHFPQANGAAKTCTFGLSPDIHTQKLFAYYDTLASGGRPYLVFFVIGRSEYIAWCLTRPIWGMPTVSNILYRPRTCLDSCTTKRPRTIFWHGWMSDKSRQSCYNRKKTSTITRYFTVAHRYLLRKQVLQSSS